MERMARTSGTKTNRADESRVLGTGVFERRDQASARQLQSHVSLGEFRCGEDSSGAAFAAGRKNCGLVPGRGGIRAASAGESQFAGVAVGAVRERKSE